MKIKTSELIGPALDWAVAWCELMRRDYRDSGLLVHRIGYGMPMPPYSTDWAQGGPVIEREGIQWCELNGQIESWSGFDYVEWRRDWDSPIRMGEGSGFGTGPTILIASMRCYVLSKLGDEVEVPEELLREL